VDAPGRLLAIMRSTRLGCPSDRAVRARIGAASLRSSQNHRPCGELPDPCNRSAERVCRPSPAHALASNAPARRARPRRRGRGRGRSTLPCEA